MPMMLDKPWIFQASETHCRRKYTFLAEHLAHAIILPWFQFDAAQTMIFLPKSEQFYSFHNFDLAERKG
jgi:hypothetical protein